MALQFPYIASYDELALLPEMADAHGWDDSQADEDDEPNLAARIRNYNSALNKPLHQYLMNIGYVVTDDGIAIMNDAALRTACALFNQICFEYDDPEATHYEVDRTYGDKTYKVSTTATWDLFGLSGDDDVDYNGSQPSALADLLLAIQETSDDPAV